MQCTSPVKIRNGRFPCGHCLNCRIAKAREWSARLMHELDSWHGKAVFVTLTYSDKYLPIDYGLHKRHLQLFFKRLRKRLGKQKIKYYACGEYGDEALKADGTFKYPSHLGRPHYHAIIFGIGRSDAEKELIKDCWRFCVWEMFEDEKAFGTVTYDSARYVSDYIFKKYNNEKAKEIYKELEIPFKINSGGLGLSFCMSEAVNFRENMGFYMHGSFMALPRYYVDKLGLKLECQDELYVKQWQNYAKKYHYQVADVAELIESQQRQRALTTERMTNLHRKGEL